MPELHVRCRIKPVDSLPGDVLPFGGIGSEFLDFRFVRGNHLMACHTESNAGNSGVRSLGHAGVAAGALHAMLEMKLVIEGDWLDGRGLPKEKFSDCTKNSVVSRRKDGGDSRGRRVIGRLHWGRNIRVSSSFLRCPGHPQNSENPQSEGRENDSKASERTGRTRFLATVRGNACFLDAGLVHAQFTVLCCLSVFCLSLAFCRMPGRKRSIR